MRLRFYILSLLTPFFFWSGVAHAEFREHKLPQQTPSAAVPVPSPVVPKPVVPAPAAAIPAALPNGATAPLAQGGHAPLPLPMAVEQKTETVWTPTGAMPIQAPLGGQLLVPGGAAQTPTLPQAQIPQAQASAPSPSTTASATPSAAKPQRIQLPVQPLNAPAVKTGIATVKLPLNKTRPIDLDRRARDIVIGNPDIADVVVRSPQKIYLIGKKIGTTNVFMVDAAGQMISAVDVIVEADAEGAQENIGQLLPSERIETKGVGDSIVLMGTVSSDGAAAQAQNIARRFVDDDKKIVNMLRVGSEQQVLLRVHVAEVQKAVLKQLGVENVLNPQTLGPLTLSAATSALGIGPVFGGVASLSSSDFESTLKLLEQEGLIRSLAEPNLLAVSGETASMLAGGEYPVVTAGDQDKITVTYKPFGVSLSFLPVVLDSGRISLKVATEVSALSNQNVVDIPLSTDRVIEVKSFSTRRASSTVELPSGGSMMIAGLLQNDIISSLSGVPGLQDIPILGALFRSTSFQRNETELVIMVSVMLAKPVAPELLALPTDGFAPATDLDRYLVGHLQGIYAKQPKKKAIGPSELQGPVGYMID